MTQRLSTDRLLPVFAAWFTALLILTNVLNTKIFQFGDFAFPAGIITFPATFLLSDLGTELLGYRATRRVIWLGLGAQLVMALALEIGRILPPAPFWSGQTSYETLFTQVPRIVAASVIAYWCGEFMNSYVLAKLKLRFEGRSMALRFIGSTVAGQAVDTLLFMSIAFTGVYPAGAMVRLFLSAWLFKIAWEFVALPLSLPLAAWLKKRGFDADDKNTDFNPFALNT